MILRDSKKSLSGVLLFHLVMLSEAARPPKPGLSGEVRRTKTEGRRWKMFFLAFTFVFCFTSLFGDVEVNTTSDVADGDTSSVENLENNPGPDGKISLREAIEAINNDETENEIYFDSITFPQNSPSTIYVTDNNLMEITGLSTKIDATNRGVILNGSNLTNDPQGLRISCEDFLIKNLRIESFNNTGIGLNIIGGYGLIQNNTIVQSDEGIQFSSDHSNRTFVKSNFIGTDSSWSNLGNSIGVSTSGSNLEIGGRSSEDRNYFSFNTTYGLKINRFEGDISILNNYFGTNEFGDNLGNRHALYADQMSNQLNFITIGERNAGNIFAYSQEIEIEIHDYYLSNEKIQGNYFGTDPQWRNLSSITGLKVNFPTDRSSNSVFLVGGSNQGEGNYFGNCETAAIFSDVDEGYNPQRMNVYGNYFGTNESSDNLGNNVSVLINIDNRMELGGDQPGQGNIFGFSNIGIKYGGYLHNNSKISSNLIGIDKSGNPIPNNIGIKVFGSSEGLEIGTLEHEIDRDNNPDANTIAYNTEYGIQLLNSDSRFVSFRGNSIYKNGVKAVSVENFANSSIQAPVLTSVSENSIDHRVRGVGALANDFISVDIDVYSNPPGDDQARKWLGSGRARTDGSFDFLMPGIESGDIITVTQTYNGTSELSNAVTVKSSDEIVEVTTVRDNIDGDVSNIPSLKNDPGPDGFISLREAITASQNDSNPILIGFSSRDFPSSSPKTIFLNNQLPEIVKENLVIDAMNRGVILNGSRLRRKSGLIFSSRLFLLLGMRIQNFSKNGVEVLPSGSGHIHRNTFVSNKVGLYLRGDAQVQRNWIGTDKTLGNFGNHEAGILVDGGSSLIGGAIDSENIIGFNGLDEFGAGIKIQNGQPTIMGNLIGTNSSENDKVDLGNYIGIHCLKRASNFTIGIDPELNNRGRNYICFSELSGIYMQGKRVDEVGLKWNTFCFNEGKAVQIDDKANDKIKPVTLQYAYRDYIIGYGARPHAFIDVYKNYQENTMNRYIGRFQADENGELYFDLDGFRSEDVLVAIQTDLDGNSSELSNAIVARNGIPVNTVEDVVDGDTTDTFSLVENPGEDQKFSLREIILASEGRSGESIFFDHDVFPSEEPATIFISENELPEIANRYGDINPSNAGVILDGRNLSSGVGLRVKSTYTEITGLVIRNFPNEGLVVSGSRITIGGDEQDEDANTIISNRGHGINVLEDTRDSEIFRNFIGVDRNGNAFGNSGNGIHIARECTETTIGNSDHENKNTIAFNAGYGILCSGSEVEMIEFRKNSIYSNNLGAIQLENGANGSIPSPEIEEVVGNFIFGSAISNSKIDVYVNEEGEDQAREWVAEGRTDEQGNFSFSSQHISSASSVTVIQTQNDTSSELSNAIVPTQGSDFQASSSIVASDGLTTISGTTVPFAIVYLIIDGEIVATTTADEFGNFNFTDFFIGLGVLRFRLQVEYRDTIIHEEEFFVEYAGWTRVFAYDDHYRTTGFVRRLNTTKTTDAIRSFSNVDVSDGEDYEVHEHDGANNITQITRGNDTFTVINNEMNETEQIGSFRTDMDYDEVGRLTSYTETTNNVTRYYRLTYNMRDQLTLVEVSNNNRDFTPVSNYTYYANGMRATKKTYNENGSFRSSEHYYGVGMMIHDVYSVNSSGVESSQPDKEFVYEGLDRPVAMFTDADNNSSTGELGGREAYFYHYNPKGDVYALSDESGNIVERYDYSLFGDTYVTDVDYRPRSESIVDNPHRFAGAWYDEETQYQWMRFRYYDSTLRGFLSRDPIEDDVLGNLYAFVENNPGSYVDPLGLGKGGGGGGRGGRGGGGGNGGRGGGGGNGGNGGGNNGGNDWDDTPPYAPFPGDVPGDANPLAIVFDQLTGMWLGVEVSHETTKSEDGSGVIMVALGAPLPGVALTTSTIAFNAELIVDALKAGAILAGADGPLPVGDIAAAVVIVGAVGIVAGNALADAFSSDDGDAKASDSDADGAKPNDQKKDTQKRRSRRVKRGREAQEQLESIERAQKKNPRGIERIDKSKKNFEREANSPKTKQEIDEMFGD